MVGAILVYDDRIISEGFHQQYGGPHAEVNCLQNIPANQRQLIEKSTLFVSLEPCAHYGKTPPCTDLIISKGIRDVVIGCRDINEQVNGKGIEKLEKAGIRVKSGILEKEAEALNRRFFTFHRHKRPYIILKWAQSKDHKIAAFSEEDKGMKDSKRIFISNALTNQLVHKWRSEEAAILVGTRTALNDNPALTNRLWIGSDPLRVVIDLELKLPASLQLLDGNVKTLVFNGIKQKEIGQVVYIKTDENIDLPRQILTTLFNRGISSLIIEGGAKLLQSFIDRELWDEARVITNLELTIGEGIEAPVLNRSNIAREESLYSDRICYYFNEST